MGLDGAYLHFTQRLLLLLLARLINRQGVVLDEIDKV